MYLHFLSQANEVERLSTLYNPVGLPDQAINGTITIVITIVITFAQGQTETDRQTN
jgi:hypothetical protein